MFMTQGNAYTVTRKDAHTSNTVVTGPISICSQVASILLYSGATHSFISYDFANKLDKNSEMLDCDLSITTSVGKVRKLVVLIGDRTLLGDMVGLNIQNLM